MCCKAAFLYTSCCTLHRTGTASPFARAGRANSISSHRPLLPDAVFMPEHSGYGSLQHKPSSGCNVTFVPDHVFLREASSTEAVCSDSEDGNVSPAELLRCAVCWIAPHQSQMQLAMKSCCRPCACHSLQQAQGRTWARVMCNVGSPVQAQHQMLSGG